MKHRTLRLAAMAMAIATTLGGAAFAQSATKTPAPTDRQALEQARVELDAALERYAQLSRQHGMDAVDFHFDPTIFRKPVVGVVLAPAREGGVRIAGVTPGSAAAEAGLAGGDRIVAIDGKPLAGSDADARLEMAREAIGRHDEGSKVVLRYLRDGKEKMQ